MPDSHLELFGKRRASTIHSGSQTMRGYCWMHFAEWTNRERESLTFCLLGFEVGVVMVTDFESAQVAIMYCDGEAEGCAFSLQESLSRHCSGSEMVLKEKDEFHTMGRLRRLRRLTLTLQLPGENRPGYCDFILTSRVTVIWHHLTLVNKLYTLNKKKHR
jgi:hypothetical protein